MTHISGGISGIFSWQIDAGETPAEQYEAIDRRLIDESKIRLSMSVSAPFSLQSIARFRCGYF
jgi:hypothetical protein